MALSRISAAYQLSRSPGSAKASSLCRSVRTLHDEPKKSLQPSAVRDELLPEGELRPAMNFVMYESLPEADFEEKFVKGTGPGGQKVNKSNNCVELKHKATGIVVKCHETRSLERNRELARRRLLEKLRFLFDRKNSETQRRIDETKKRKSDYDRKRRLKEEAASSLPDAKESDV